MPMAKKNLEYPKKKNQKAQQNILKKKKYFPPKVVETRSLYLNSTLAKQKTVKNKIMQGLLLLNWYKPKKILEHRLCIKTVKQIHN